MSPYPVLTKLIKEMASAEKKVSKFPKDTFQKLLRQIDFMESRFKTEF